MPQRDRGISLSRGDNFIDNYIKWAYYRRMENPVLGIINRYKYQLQAMSKHPIRNMNRIRVVKKKLQALGEANVDIMNTNIGNHNRGSSEIDKNNYLTYESKVDGAYKMYNCETDYGGEIYSAVVDCRCAFIGGEGLSVYAIGNQALQKWLDNFIEKNKLNGSRLLAMILTGELEGKNFITLSPNTKEKIIDIRSFSWYLNRYKLIKSATDTDNITGIKYRPKTDGIEGDDKTISIDRAVFVKLGCTESVTDETPGPCHKILTQCENASRAGYDLRKNTHVFGKYMPYWKTQKNEDARAINADLAAGSFEIGDGYAGTADFSLVEPSGSAAMAIEKDLLLSLRFICAMTGTPIHWLAWPDLMSNRATADSMIEVINSATIRARLVWEEAFKEIITKARIMAVDKLAEDNKILDGDFVVKLPLVSVAMLKQIQETYLPLADAGYISRKTVQSKMPGINPSEEDKQIEVEREEAAKRSPMNNETVDNALGDMQNGNKNVDKSDKGDVE